MNRENAPESVLFFTRKSLIEQRLKKVIHRKALQMARKSNTLYAEVGEICAGIKAGRENDTEITIFDSSGVSFQDLVVAHHVVGLARTKRLGLNF